MILVALMIVATVVGGLLGGLCASRYAWRPDQTYKWVIVGAFVGLALSGAWVLWAISVVESS
jgi:hypothetical protein